METQGLSLSPTLANFQNVPRGLRQSVNHCPLSLFLSFHKNFRLCVPVLMRVHELGAISVNVSAGAYHQEEHHEQGLEVEDGRHPCRSKVVDSRYFLLS